MSDRMMEIASAHERAKVLGHLALKLRDALRLATLANRSEYVHSLLDEADRVLFAPQAGWFQDPEDGR